LVKYACLLLILGHPEGEDWMEDPADTCHRLDYGINFIQLLLKADG
jgi:hypothetical protein